MKYKWEEKKLGEICSFQSGNVFPKNEQGHREGEIPFIKVSDFNLGKNHQKIITANNWISRKTSSKMKIKLTPKGAYVFAKIGEAIKAERIREITCDTAIDNNIMAAIPNKDIESKFLQYILENIHLANYAEGSAVPYLKQKNLELIDIIIPPVEIRKKIIYILQTIEDKIDINKQINDNLTT